MGVDFIALSTEEIKRVLLNLFQKGNRSLNLIIQLGSYREFQKLINIRMAIDEINSSAQAKILISKETEKSNSMDQEEKNGSDGDDNTGCSFANVLVIMHLSPHSVELRKLKTLPGLNFWSGWELRVLEKLEMTVNDISLNKNLYRPLPFNELFIPDAQDQPKKDDQNSVKKDRETELRDFGRKMVGRVLLHEYQNLVRELVQSLPHLNFSSFNLGQVKKVLLSGVGEKEEVGSFFEVFQQQLNSRIKKDQASQSWTEYVLADHEADRTSQENAPEYLDIEKAISTAFQEQNSSKIEGYLKYLMLPENLNNISAYILGCSTKVPGLKGPHDELIEQFLTLDTFDFIEYVRNNRQVDFADVYDYDEDLWPELFDRKFKDILKNPLYEYRLSLKTFLKDEKNRFVSYYSLEGMSSKKSVYYKLPIYEKNYQAIQKSVKEFKDWKNFLFSCDYKHVKKIIKLYKKDRSESLKSQVPNPNDQFEADNFKKNEKLVNLIFDRETVQDLPQWMIKGEYTNQTKDFFFDMFLDLIKTLFPDQTNPYSDQEYFSVFELITLCLRQPNADERDSPLYYFKGIYFAFEFLNPIIKNIIVNIHKGDSEVEFLMSNLRKWSEAQKEKVKKSEVIKQRISKTKRK
jgi:hypothetical protein